MQPAMQPEGRWPRQRAMRKHVAAGAAIAVVAIAAVACSSGGKSGVSGGGAHSTADFAQNESTNATAGEAGSAARAPASGGLDATAPKSGAQAALSATAIAGRDLVQTASITVRIKDVNDASHRVEQLATSAGGFVATENLSSNPDSSDNTATLTLRVPQASYDKAIAAIEGLGTRLSAE